MEVVAVGRVGTFSTCNHVTLIKTLTKENHHFNTIKKTKCAHIKVSVSLVNFVF